MATILVIDDTVKILEIVEFFLKAEGYEVKTASSPHEGLRIAADGGLDLIILDIMMPGMDGYQVYELLKKNPASADVPVIMLTARAIIEHTPKDFFYGLYGFMAKPFSRRQLVELVKNTLKMTSEGAEGEVKADKV
jgi:DNA-binding response OmpR family regulator